MVWQTSPASEIRCTVELSCAEPSIADLIFHGEKLGIAVEHCSQWIYFDESFSGRRVMYSEPSVNPTKTCNSPAIGGSHKG